MGLFNRAKSSLDGSSTDEDQQAPTTAEQVTTAPAQSFGMSDGQAHQPSSASSHQPATVHPVTHPAPEAAVSEATQAPAAAQEPAAACPTQHAQRTLVVVDVMPKPQILDPQGKAVVNSLKRLGYSGLSVRQGKRFEIMVDGEATDEVIAQITDAADKLLANTVIESYRVRIGDEPVAGAPVVGTEELR